jgi:hypothetical protein
MRILEIKKTAFGDAAPTAWKESHHSSVCGDGAVQAQGTRPRKQCKQRNSTKSSLLLTACGTGHKPMKERRNLINSGITLWRRHRLINNSVIALDANLCALHAYNFCVAM